MAMPEKVVQRWNAMTRTGQEQTVDFIDFLLLRRRQDNVPRKTHFELDALAGGLEFIADNFDETPEEFEEYM
ncbi:MAG: hypothetical protein IJH25_02055 [Clostridia bacterium]|nr:hypothetical protein [Clostridia bacterium]